MLSEYRDSEEHFKHVLDCLILPSIKKAGFEAIPPKAKGADLIHAGIVNNLEISDLVLCDISTLNPNVFFEFGIRTSLNKPVCVIKDNLTKVIPFDTAILNYLEYDSSIEPWKIEGETDTLSKHIIDSYERSSGSNDMWKYFGFKSEAVPAKGELSQEAQYQYLSNKIENISTKMDELYRDDKSHSYSYSTQSRLSREKKIQIKAADLRMIESLIKNREYSDVEIEDIDATEDGDILVFAKGDASEKVKNEIVKDIKKSYPYVKSVHVFCYPDRSAIT